jgi:hypothetical protein
MTCGLVRLSTVPKLYCLPGVKVQIIKETHAITKHGEGSRAAQQRGLTALPIRTPTSLVMFILNVLSPKTQLI